jgi:hypothetical protein
LVNIDGKSCILALPHSNTTFRATSVKPYFTPTAQIEGIEVELASRTSKEPASEPSKEPAPLLVKRGRGRPRKNPHITIFLQNDAKYEDSRQAKITSLLKKGIFEVIPKSEVLGGSRIFNSRFVNKVKNKGTKNERKKLRLVVQAYNDDKKRLILTQSLTI